jgi:hypothetical protein
MFYQALTLPDIKGYGTEFLVVYVEDKIDDAAAFKMQIGNGKNQVGNGGGIAGAFYVHVAGDGVYAHFPVQVSGFDSEAVVGKFPKVKTKPDDDGQLRVNAGKIPGNDGVKGAYDGQFPAVFLGKIAKGKQFYFHNNSLKRPLLSAGLEPENRDPAAFERPRLPGGFSPWRV